MESLVLSVLWVLMLKYTDEKPALRMNNRGVRTMILYVSQKRSLGSF